MTKKENISVAFTYYNNQQELSKIKKISNRKSSKDIKGQYL
jgi:hypothetical protein